MVVELGLALLKCHRARWTAHVLTCGFIQRSNVVEILQMDDTDGFNGRQLLDCPPEINVYYKDIKVPMDSGIPTFTTILRT